MEYVKTVNISLPDPLGKFVQQKVDSGSYSSASEVVREGLRLLQQYDAERLRLLRAAIKVGLGSGEGPLLEDVSTEQIVARAKKRLKKRAS